MLRVKTISSSNTGKRSSTHDIGNVVNRKSKRFDFSSPSNSIDQTPPATSEPEDPEEKSGCLARPTGAKGNVKELKTVVNGAVKSVRLLIDQEANAGNFNWEKGFCG